MMVAILEFFASTIFALADRFFRDARPDLHRLKCVAATSTNALQRVLCAVMRLSFAVIRGAAMLPRRDVQMTSQIASTSIQRFARPPIDVRAARCARARCARAPVRCTWVPSIRALTPQPHFGASGDAIPQLLDTKWVTAQLCGFVLPACD